MKKYVPKQGDLVEVDFSPTVGHEQSGSRRALVVTPEQFNEAIGLIWACPTTTKVKNHPFEVEIPKDLGVNPTTPDTPSVFCHPERT